ncbi:MAG: UDP-glucose 4-epimerase GalE [Ruminococcaceae bacterium]|nr:UDP-glucose 4-epimerase GalE [Oscillospiraceae bacterium]
MNVLVTGGMGYIGSHTCVELINEKHTPIIIDNLSNSKPEVLDKIQMITGVKPAFYEGDVANEALLEKIFTENKIDAVIHFAGYKAVGESVLKPVMYYQNNIGCTLVLCNVMAKYGCKNIVFSSSATVYGVPKSVPITEDMELHSTSPYGRTKLMIEEILRDVYVSDNEWNIVLLRYFNPIGAHSSGLIGEEPQGIPNNLMPYIMKVAVGELPHLNVFGNDYDTHDGTGVRDYIHVVDLAKGHLRALEHLDGAKAYNLGTGIGYSVLDIVKAFEKVNGIKIPYEIKERRPGDISEYYANPEKALKELNWKAELTIEDMCSSVWKYAQNYIKG